MISIAIDFPDDVFASLRRSPAELARDVRLAAALDWYQRGVVSQARAAELAGVPRVDFLDALAERKVEVFAVDLDTLREELELG